MIRLLKFLRARLLEPSTHAGIAGVLAGLAQFNATICWLAAVEGCVAFLLKEGASASSSASSD